MTEVVTLPAAVMVFDGSGRLLMTNDAGTWVIPTSDVAKSVLDGLKCPVVPVSALPFGVLPGTGRTVHVAMCPCPESEAHPGDAPGAVWTDIDTYRGLGVDPVLMALAEGALLWGRTFIAMCQSSNLPA